MALGLGIGLQTGLWLDELKYFWFCSGAAKEQIASEAGERRSVCVCVCVRLMVRVGLAG